MATVVPTTASVGIRLEEDMVAMGIESDFSMMLLRVWLSKIVPRDMYDVEFW